MYNPSCGLDAPSGEDVFFFDVRMFDAKLLKMRGCADVKYQGCEDAPCILEKLWWFILGSRRLECQPSTGSFVSKLPVLLKNKTNLMVYKYKSHKRPLT